jgi:pimeloyl-ACP methyl ester carboxylesterase
MENNRTDPHSLRHRKIAVDGASIHIVEGGAAGRPAILFLHGWPESWKLFEQIMLPLSAKAHVVALDLPGIGASVTPPDANDKRTLARYVHGVLTALNLQHVTFVGHDVGGMIVYAYLHVYPETLQRAVIMNVVIPGLDPWFDVVRNPHIWHFAFHAIPELPERLVAGKQAAYFDYFYDQLAGLVGSGFCSPPSEAGLWWEAIQRAVCPDRSPGDEPTYRFHLTCRAPEMTARCPRQNLQ